MRQHGFERGSQPIQIVVTPGSGNGQALATARQLYRTLSARGRGVRLEVFDDLDDLGRWARARDASFSLLICVGGDGTQSAAAPAAMRRSVPFLPVPCGFGNLFAGTLGHSPRVNRVLEVLDSGEVVRLDVGVRGGEPFLCQEGFGLLSEIQARAEASKRRPRGRWRRSLAYYRMAIRYLRKLAPKPLRVTVDGRVVAHDAIVVVVANVPSYGPWLPLTPEASPVDGRFDVFALGGTKLGALARLLRVHLRIPGTDRTMRLVRGRHVSVAAPGAAPTDLRVLPGQLPVVVSRETAQALGRERAQLRVA